MYLYLILNNILLNKIFLIREKLLSLTFLEFSKCIFCFIPLFILTNPFVILLLVCGVLVDLLITPMSFLTFWLQVNFILSSATFSVFRIVYGHILLVISISCLKHNRTKYVISVPYNIVIISDEYQKSYNIL